MDLLMMKLRQLLKQGCAAPGEGNNHDPAIFGVVGSLHQAIVSGPFDESHHGVMLLLQELGQLRHRRRSAPRVSRDAKQKLMLLRSHAGLPGRVFAEAEKYSQRIAKLGKLSNDRVGSIFR